MFPAFLPGPLPPAARPLNRYLPALPGGAAAGWLAERLPPGSWVVDPFGASPRTAIEAARAGYRVLVAANNPIARFLLELHASPPSEAELRQALADLAVTTKAGQRLEAYLRGLYTSECAQCHRPVEVQAFVWEREAAAPAGRIYACPYCKDAGERPATPADIEHAARFAAGGLHRARALERVAPLADPDRVHAEEALAMYLPRAVDALFNLVNKLDGFPPARRRLLAALLLAAFDQGCSLWPQPAGRTRPRQLSLPPRFLEKNIWLALEDAVCAWPQSLAGPPVALYTWPEAPPPEGGLCIFEGRLKDLADPQSAAPPAGFAPAGMLAALPRPNQAYWTLSALWAGWLWGAEATAAFKVVLRRRRYDWAWHAEALQGAFGHLSQLLPDGTPCLGLLGEVEPGFLGAALLAASQTGFALDGLALRAGDDQAQVHWLRQSAAPGGTADPLSQSEAVCAAAWGLLRRQGEPADYAMIYSAMSAALVQPAAASLEAHPPGDLLRQMEARVESALLLPEAFSRYGAGRTLESGQWWLGAAVRSDLAEALELPLADRVEMELVRLLQRNPGLGSEALDRKLCAAFPGLLTPASALIAECLRSYAEQQPPESGGWRLRSEDTPAARRADLAAMRQLLGELGRRLGFRVDGEQGDLPTRTPLRWLSAPAVQAAPVGQAAHPGTGLDQPAGYAFYVIASGTLGSLVFSAPAGAGLRPVIVLPGGRAGWVEYRLRRDPRLRAAVEKDWLLVKYRHIRRLAGQPDLSAEKLAALLPGDPLANKDPQMALL